MNGLPSLFVAYSLWPLRYQFLTPQKKKELAMKRSLGCEPFRPLMTAAGLLVSARALSPSGKIVFSTIFLCVKA